PVEAGHQAPGTETEHLLCNLWSLVLGIEVTGINSHFFKVGGHSLKATLLVSRIRESFGIEVPLQMIFERPILREQGQWLDKQQRGPELPPIVPLKEGEPLVLSFAQQRLWFLAQLEGQSAPQGQSTAYNMPIVLHLEGHLNMTALESALAALIERHHSLRVCFPPGDGGATVQLNDVYNPLSIDDLSEFTGRGESCVRPASGGLERQVTQLVNHHAQAPFDLETGPLLKVRLLKLGKQEHMMLFNMHHIISDGWSMGVMIGEWNRLYDAYAQEWVAPTAQEGEPVLPEPAIQYTDYAAWQRNWLEGDLLEQQLEYWTRQLTGAPELLELPTDYPRPAVMSHRGSHLKRSLDRELTRGIKQLCRRQGVTVFMTLLAAFNGLLSRYSGQSDVVVGSPIANRTHHQTEDLIGFFVNTLVMRTQINGRETFSQLLKQVRQTALGAYSHQDIPFEYLVEQLNPPRSLSHSPLFQVLLVLQNAPEEELKLGGLKMTFPEYRQTTAKFDLTLNVTEKDDALICNWSYNTDLFRPDTIARMTEHFRVLLEGILNNSEQPVCQLPLLTEAEKHQLAAWNPESGLTLSPESRLTISKTIVDLFGEQVGKTPDNIAMIFEDRQVSYRELNRKSNRLAHYLKTTGVKSGTLVGLFVERSFEMVIGLLGILKAGGAYVPLDPDYPVSRLRFITGDSAVPVLIYQRHLMEKLPPSTAKAICLDNPRESVMNAPGGSHLGQIDPGNPAYVIYTSGSTGKPKGVSGTHKGMVNRINWAWESFPYENKEICCLRSSFNSVGHVGELFAPLLKGVPVVLLNKETMKDVLGIINVLFRFKIRRLLIFPSMLKIVLEQGEPVLRKLKSMKYWYCSGEALPDDLAGLFYDNLPEGWLINTYGSSEDSADVTASHLKEGDSVSIGKPIFNTLAYVLDEYLNNVPVGVSGELHVGGISLACGYLNRPELTDEKFIQPELFGKKERLYKTGDLVRWLPDGNLQYLGRVDQQIKLRGFRIELSEIEVTLGRHEAVKEAVVVLDNRENTPRLIAYVTLLMPVDDIAGILRPWLKDRLPEYMVPSNFTVIDELPLTPNGKVDRKALPEPDFVIRDEPQQPQTETEHLLCSLWSQVLRVEVTGIHSHFFDSGGHSLLATQLVSRIREIFEIEMPLRVLFEWPVLREQAQWLDNQQRGPELPPIVPLKEGEPLVLSFAQQRLWFLAQLEGQSATYNISAALHLEGRLNITALQQSLRHLVQRHNSLRLCFPTVDGEATVQLNDVYNPLSVIDLSKYSEGEQQRQVTERITGHAHAPFDLATGPLLNVLLLKPGEAEHILLFNIRHIISDAWSRGVLVREWSHLYNAYDQNRPPQLPHLPIQYTDYAAWQRGWLEGEVLDRQLDYWKEKLNGAPELSGFPTDYPRPAVMSHQGKNLVSTLGPEPAQGIKRFSREHDVTVFMTLLAAFNVLLFRYSGQTDLLVGSPIANRTHHQTEDLIGFFVNTLALRSQINGEQTFSEFLKQVRHTALEAYSRQDIPFEYLVEQINPDRSLGHSPLFQVMLVLQNTPREELELNDLTLSFPESENMTSKFDLTLSVFEDSGGFVCNWQYCSDLFRPDTITRMTEHFRVMLEGIIENPGHPIHRLPLLSEEEKRRFLQWNQTHADYPDDKTITDLLEEQLNRTPDNIAVVFEDRQISYRELNTKANRLAHYLKVSGAGVETLIGVFIERSIDMVIAVFGILKAGAAYVPLDTSYPPARLRFIVADTSMPVILGQHDLSERMSFPQARVICPDSLWEEDCSQPVAPPVNPNTPDSLAYVIYTSGSTGQPRGIVTPHRGAVNVLYHLCNRYELNTFDKVPQLASFSFDASVRDMIGPLTRGAQVLMIDQHTVKQPGILLSLVHRFCITGLLSVVPSLLKALVEHHSLKNSDSSPYPSLRLILLSGEALQLSLYREAVEIFGSRVLMVNQYGATECTMASTDHPLSPLPSDNEIALAGRPVPNMQVYILDNRHNHVPVGVPGELHFAGIGLTRGYLNRPELTAEKFEVRSSKCELSSTLYKTGDLARWLPDGNIEFLGRIDHQVKLRGFRIELSEIECALNLHEAVKETVAVLYNKDANPRLIAYVELSKGLEGLKGLKGDRPENVGMISGLREWLKERLPEYMVPAGIILLDRFPLTPNGKIDRKALPDPVLSGSTENPPPVTETERLLCMIWSQLLGMEVTGILSHFFESGGHSLLATQLSSRIRQSFAIEIPLQVIFERPRLEDQAQWLDNRQRGVEIPPITPLPEDQPPVLSFAQERLWFMAQLEGQSPTYNMPRALHLEGPLSVIALRQSLSDLVQSHHSLRLSFPKIDGEAAVQLNEVYDPLSIIDLSEDSETEQQHRVTEWIVRHAKKPFDLNTGPLLSVCLLKLGNGKQVLLFNMHHIISDGWSMGVLIREWGRLYNAYAQGEEPGPPKPSIQYTDYAAWQRTWLQGDLLEQQLEYWTLKLSGAPELLELPTDIPRPAVMSYRG
ncbi:MAG: amino acid adenylation domain-containing protein, partial [bacterium]|nr:amino acid adenylation domain-containing protein [bacterium]